MEWGKFPIYLTLECINTFFAIIWFRHSDEYQWETIGYVIQTTARRKTLLFCVHRRRAFIHTVTNTFPFVVSRSSIHTVCDKLWERLCHLRKRLCQTSETIVQSAWHSCATAMAQSCQRRGTSMPKGWHEQSIPSTPRPLCFLCPPDGAFAKMRYIPQKVYLQKDSLSNSQTGIAAWYGWQ